MPRIPIGARVMVSPEFRYVYDGDDALWTGVVVDSDNNDGEPLSLVRFDDKNEWWHVAATLVVLS